MSKRARPPAMPEAREDHLTPAIQRATIKAGDTVLREPIAIRDEWDDPDDKNERSKTPRRVLAYRRADPLLKYYRVGADKDFTVTRDHLVAADRLREDNEMGQGARPGYEKLAEVRSGGTSYSGPSDRQIEALGRYTKAICAIGVRQSDIVICVVLNNVEVGAWSEMRGVSAHRAMGMLIANLDRLVDHYGIISTGKQGKIR